MLGQKYICISACPVRSFFEEKVAGLIVCFVAGSVLLQGLVRRVTWEFSYAMEWIFYDPGRTGRCWLLFLKIALLKGVKYQCGSSRWKATIRSSNCSSIETRG